MYSHLTRTVLAVALLSTLSATAGQPARSVAQAPVSFAPIGDFRPESRPVSAHQGQPLFAALSDDTVLFSAYSPDTGTELWRVNADGQGATLVRDIWPGGGSSLADYEPGYVVHEQYVLFAANDGATGDELWRADGGPDGRAYRVADLDPGAIGSAPGQFTRFRGATLFTTRLANRTSMLWVTDGTPDGTRPLRTFNAIGKPFVTSFGVALFAATGDASTGFELWRTDGTADGTQLVLDIAPGPASSSPASFSEIPGNQVLFSADNGTVGQELWRTSGLPGEAALVKNLATGPTHAAYPAPLTILTYTNPSEGFTVWRALFSAATSTGAHGLWHTNGLPDSIVVNTQLIYSAGADTSRPALIGGVTREIGGTFYDHALLSMRRPNGQLCLFITDGSAVGTVALSDVSPLIGGAGTVAQLFGRYYYAAGQNESNPELWRTNGTAAGTELVAELYPGATGSMPRQLTTLGKRVIFVADDAVHGRELFATDGAGAALIADIEPGPSGSDPNILGLAGDWVYFTAYDSSAGRELWRTNGTPEGTHRVANIAADVDGLSPDRYIQQSFAGMLAPMGGHMMLNMPGPDGASGLWMSGGSAATTTMLRAFDAESFQESLGALVGMDDHVQFVAAEQKSTHELWRTDGTVFGTGILTNVVRPHVGSIAALMRLHDLTVFTTFTAVQGLPETPYHALWSSNGTPNGTHILTTAVNAEIGPHAASGDSLYFVGAGRDGLGIWRTNGTIAGTRLLTTTVYRKDDGDYPVALIAGVPGEIYFVTLTVSDKQTPWLWHSDGTREGTRRLVKLPLLPLLSKGENPDAIAYLNGTVVFTAQTEQHGQELWRSDGTESGTQLLLDIFPGAGSSQPAQLTLHQGQLFFAATGADGRRLLWRSDGTAQGTAPVRNDPLAPSHPDQLTSTRFGLVFSAATPEHGAEIWRSDGTANGTQLLDDIAPGPRSSAAYGFAASTTHLYAMVYSSDTGHETWAAAMPLSPVPPPSSERRIHLPLVVRGR